ncbi:hypothetical protein THIOM_005136 [Candidatus Thiomargarita nelsonii]|uniref:Uncharacterized protein n=1 Tax=Candidatus Thiomargarita nelsonii TaxID=1003181 RepID=A0A176RU26_9GAMM|nr:hypothetical protein THIOM_005136 [Candidatus Thiomargarita nelsonii]
MAIKYVINTDKHGWLIVRHKNGSTYPPLPKYLKVDLFRPKGGREKGRDYFRILEGRYKGKIASVRRNGTQSYLGSAIHKGPAKIHFDIAKKQLWFGEKSYWIFWSQPEVTAETFTEPRNPIPKGTYDIEIPYENHSLGGRYLGKSLFATTWFRIGHSGDRFLHPGNISAGCVTVKDIGEWTKIYNYLINSRKGDSLSVGTIEIV